MILRLPNKPVRLIGLTGSIATGKSAAAGFFEKLGVPVVDADLLAREVVRPGEAGLSQIVKRFGEGVLNPDGTLDRSALGRVIFADEDARRGLNAILHPLIAASAEKMLFSLLENHPVAVYAVPLLYETGLAEKFDIVAVVRSSRENQLGRLMKRDAIGLEEAARKIAAQMDVEKKAAAAGAVFENDGEMEGLGSQIGAFMEEIARHNRSFGL